MAFSTRRGRPRKRDSHLAVRDYGTPELQQKRSLSLTTETVDLLLKKGLITDEQHWCALHFRWLYTLRYGSPTPQSVDPARVRGILHRKIYPEWQSEREKEWQQAIQELTRGNSLSSLRQCAIYNQIHPSQLNELQSGLQVLALLWCHSKATISYNQG